MSEQAPRRRLAAILAADVVGYSRLMQADEAGTLATLKSRRTEIFQPRVSKHHGRIVKLMGDGALVEFASAVDAVECAVQLQQGMDSANADLSEDRRIRLRIGVNLGDVMVEGSDLYGDGVNIAARLESLADPGGVFVSRTVVNHVRGKVKLEFEDLGDKQLKNIAEPVRAYRIVLGRTVVPARSALVVPDKPSIAVLPFQNMSGDPEQDYFADGIVEEIITALSRMRWLFVIARNSSFTYKGRAVDVKQVGRELGVRYVLEGSVRKAASRVRITGQLVDASTGAHLWAERFEANLEDIFDLQDQVTVSVVGRSRRSWSRPRSNAPGISRPTVSTPMTISCVDWPAFTDGREKPITRPYSFSTGRLNSTPNLLRPMAWQHAVTLSGSRVGGLAIANTRLPKLNGWQDTRQSWVRTTPSRSAQPG